MHFYIIPGDCGHGSYTLSSDLGIKAQSFKFLNLPLNFLIASVLYTYNKLNLKIR